MKFNSILLVLPILTVLMFDLGLSLRVSDFVNIFKKPKAMLAGLAGQLVILPLIALAIGSLAGICLRRYAESTAHRMDKVLSKCAEYMLHNYPFKSYLEEIIG